MLKSSSPGDVTSERLELPNVNGAGAATAVVSNQRETLRWSVGRLGSRSTFTRCIPCVKALVLFVCTLICNGAPCCSTPIIARLQPPNSRAGTPLVSHVLSLPSDTSYTELATKRLRMSFPAH